VGFRSRAALRERGDGEESGHGEFLLDLRFAMCGSRPVGVGSFALESLALSAQFESVHEGHQA
jgi:hypothetical protein